MYFSIFDFDAFNVHRLTGYGPAVQLLSAITWTCWGNGYCTLRSSNLENFANLSKRQRLHAMKLLEEHGLIKVEERIEGGFGQVSNRITRLPIMQEHFDLYLDHRRMFGLKFELSFFNNGGGMSEGMRPEYVEGLGVSKPVHATPQNRATYKKTPVEIEAPPVERAKKDNSGGVASPPLAAESTSLVPISDLSPGVGGRKRRDPLRYLMSVILSLTDQVKELPRSKVTQKKLRGIVKRMGMKKAEAYLRYVIDKGEAWMANFDWGIPDLYALMCRGAVRQWRVDTGQLQLEKITKDTRHRRRLDEDEWDATAMANEKEVGW